MIPNHSFGSSFSKREILWKQNQRTFQHLGYSEDRLRWFDRTSAKIEHSGCINAAKWSQYGDLLYTGSDDRLVKIWRMTSTWNDVRLAHKIETKHRGNIFCVDPSPVQEDLIVTGAADGHIRTNYLHDPNAGVSILSSDDLIHMFRFDVENPQVIYSAEETGNIHRIDLRFNHSKELLFENKSSCYKNSPIYNNDPYISGLLPRWTEKGAVKALVQTPTISSPHLIIGGRGFVIGMLDLRITNRPTLEEENSSTSLSPALVNIFTKMWSPYFPTSSSSINAKQTLIRDKYTNLNAFHPWSNNRDMYDPEFLSLPANTSSSLFGRFDEGVAISGLDVSKDGKRIVASYRNDQIYTFNLKCTDSIDGIVDVMGGHINSATFLKSVHFFGPNDEYVVSGSDSGHLWMWESQSTIQKNPRIVTMTFETEKDSTIRKISEENNHVRGGKDELTLLDTTCCKLVTVLRADNRTCNGVVPHPIAPLLVSYGIDSDAKLWAYKTVDTDDAVAKDPFANINEHEIARFHANNNQNNGNISVAGGTSLGKPPAVVKYPFCKHEGVRDAGKFTRVSIPLKLHNQTSPYNAMINYPFLLETNKIHACSLYAEKVHNIKSKQMSQVLSPSDFNDTVYQIRDLFFQQAFQAIFQDKQLQGHYQTLKKDYGPFMPSDVFYEVMDLYQYDPDSLHYLTTRFLPYAKQLEIDQYDGIDPNQFLSTTFQRFYHLFLRHCQLKQKKAFDFFRFIEHPAYEFTAPNRLLFYLFLPVLEFLKIVDLAKQNGNEAYKQKELDVAHFFYCKGIRYGLSVLTLNFIDLITHEGQRKKRKKKVDLGVKTRVVAGSFATTTEGEIVCGSCVTMTGDSDLLQGGNLSQMIQSALGGARLPPAIAASLGGAGEESKTSENAPTTSSSAPSMNPAAPAASASSRRDRWRRRSHSRNRENKEEAAQPMDEGNEMAAEDKDDDEIVNISDPNDNDDDGDNDEEEEDLQAIEDEILGDGSSPPQSSSPARPEQAEKMEGVESTADSDQKERAEGDEQEVGPQPLDTKGKVSKLCFDIVTLLQEEIVPELVFTLFNNLAMTFIAMEKPLDGLNVCDDAIEFAKKCKIEVDAKLFFRRGTVNLHLHNYEEAMEDLQKAMNLNPKDNAIQNKFKEAKRLHDMKRKREMKAYSKMFDEERL